jgi:hypothetical protein
LLNGMATGLFLAAAVTELAAPAVFTPMAKVAYKLRSVPSWNKAANERVNVLWKKERKGHWR